MKWHLKKYSDLTLDQLYDILALRCEIFIVEQVAYQDPDGLDKDSLHLFAYDDETGLLAAYLRILPRGLAYPEAAIGRVCVRRSMRGRGLASRMMDKALEYVDYVMGESEIHISAQRYLLEFYMSKGFEPVGEGYLEDGIPHIGMTRKRIL